MYFGLGYLMHKNWSTRKEQTVDTLGWSTSYNYSLASRHYFHITPDWCANFVHLL